MEELMPETYFELTEVFDKLEHHYADMQDVEFTVEEKKLYILQTRNGKRTARAAVRTAVDMVRERLIDRETAVARIEPAQLERLLHPMLDESAAPEPIGHGLQLASARGQFLDEASERRGQNRHGVQFSVECLGLRGEFGTALRNDGAVGSCPTGDATPKQSALYRDHRFRTARCWLNT